MWPDGGGSHLALFCRAARAQAQLSGKDLRSFRNFPESGVQDLLRHAAPSSNHDYVSSQDIAANPLLRFIHRYYGVTFSYI